MLLRWQNPLTLRAFEPADFDDPFRMFDQLRRQMDRLFWDFERELGRPGSDAFGLLGGWPGTSLADSGSELLLRAELPGMSENEIEISVTENTVTLSGERKDDTPEGYTVHRKERGAVKFTKSFDLPCKIDSARADATMKHGVLLLTLPKAQEARPHQIAVRASS